MTNDVEVVCLFMRSEIDLNQICRSTFKDVLTSVHI